MTIQLLADENFDGDLFRALLRLEPTLDLIRVQDAGLSGTDDPGVLARAAEGGRVLLTHDARTMPRHAYERVAVGQPMPGVLLVSLSASMAALIESIQMVVGASSSEELADRVTRLPIR